MADGAGDQATENLAAENAAIFSQLRRLVRALEDTTESLHHERGLRRDAMTALQREKTKAEVSLTAQVQQPMGAELCPRDSLSD